MSTELYNRFAVEALSVAFYTAIGLLVLLIPAFAVCISSDGQKWYLKTCFTRTNRSARPGPAPTSNLLRGWISR